MPDYDLTKLARQHECSKLHPKDATCRDYMIRLLAALEFQDVTVAALISDETPLTTTIKDLIKEFTIQRRKHYKDISNGELALIFIRRSERLEVILP